jgi:hypothetical protein
MLNRLSQLVDKTKLKVKGHGDEHSASPTVPASSSATSTSKLQEQSNAYARAVSQPIPHRRSGGLEEGDVNIAPAELRHHARLCYVRV